MLGCHEYDYIEIACMFHYPLRLTLKTGEVIEGIALDTSRNDRRDECIKLQLEFGDQLVVLEAVKSLEVLTENPHFSRLDFQSSW